MRVPGAAELLDLWETGLSQPLARRTLALLAAAHPETTTDELAALPIGRRDALVLDLRERLFGPDLTIIAPCPECGERLESTFPVADLRVGADEEAQAPQTIEIDGYRLAFRLPTSADLIALSPTADLARGRQMVLGRCLLEARAINGEDVTSQSLPEPVVQALAARLLAADPQADVELALSCPSCGHAWPAVFDIAGFAWREIHAWAKLTLRIVNSLARAYGWREADILSLSPTRRQIYLELARQ